MYKNRYIINTCMRNLIVVFVLLFKIKIDSNWVKF